jgi:hypothetical protein
MESLRVTQGLLDARVTLQRLDDARLLHGWIIRVRQTLLSIRATDEPVLKVGERFAARTARLNGDVAFIAQLTESNLTCAQDHIRRAAHQERATYLDYLERVFVFQVLGEMVPMAASGDPRYICEPSRVTVGEAEAELRDVSPSGLGVVTLAPVFAGEVLPVVAEVDGRKVEVRAEVRYCRRVSTLPPLFRVGLRVLSAGRIDQARWLSVVRQRSAQGYRAREMANEPLPVEPMPLPSPEETGLDWKLTTKGRRPSRVKFPEVQDSELWEGPSPVI